MYKDKSEKYHTILKRARHYLFLNPYHDTAFTRCPKCEEKTKFCEQNAPEIVGNDFFVLGTMDRKDWKKGQTEEMSQQEAIKRLFPFKDAWNFEVIPAGWYPKEQVKSRNRGTHKD